MRFRIDPDTLDFALPDELIAQEPTPERDQARLLVLRRSTGQIEHRRFADLGDYLRAGDVLVLNKAKVSKTKLTGKKNTGGKVEVIFLEKLSVPGATTEEWKALVRPPVKDGAEFEVGGDDDFSSPAALTLAVARREPAGEYVLTVKRGDVERAITQNGRLPLPPYIKRPAGDPRTASDERDYQTVYAKIEGSVAAPTAGLHFSERLLSDLKNKGVHVVEILLHVGWGTFKPIADKVATHQMLGEKYEVTPDAMETLNAAKREHRRIVAVGTTSTRTLESLDGATLTGETSLFIKPGFQFKWIDALITNLHVPRSTPVSLTATFSGLKNLEQAYAAAIDERYRFYSYGDAMLIL